MSRMPPTARQESTEVEEPLWKEQEKQEEGEQEAVEAVAIAAEE